MPQFSVVIPTKDRPAMLRRALRSALAQREADFEIVVADDGDETGAALALTMAPHGLKTIVTGRLGQVPARNLAIASAEGEWIAFLDDDDHWTDPHHLRRLAEAFADGVGLACADGRIVREGPGARADDWLPITADIDPARLCRDNTLIVSGVAYVRALHGRLGPLDEGLPHYWDWDWYLRISGAGFGFAATGSDGVRISTRLDNVSSPWNEQARRDELARLCAKHGLVGVTLKNHEIIALEQQRGTLAAE